MGIYTDSTTDKQQAERAAHEVASKNGVVSFGPFGSFQPSDLASMDQRLHGLVDKIFDNKFFENDNWKSWGLGSRPEWDFFDNYHKGRSIPGLKAYPVPSATQYQECKESKGLAVWDENGWWRCLFPKALNQNGDLSKEDVEFDRENKYGVFFKDYTSLLDWKVQVNKLVKEKEEQQRVQKETETLNDIYADYDKDVNWLDNKNDTISTSKSVHFKTLPNGDAEEITEIHNTFRDGRTENKKFKKLIPKEGSPIIEDLSAGDSKLLANGKDSKLLNWIWDEKK